MNGLDVVRALKRKLDIKTDQELASRLGMTYVSILNWKKRPSITPLQLANLVHSSLEEAAKNIQATAIRPIVEFYRIEKSAQSQLFSVKDERAGEHPYRRGLRKELVKSRGVYVFFDSRGKAIYAGKTKLQTLWKEMNLAFNRNRGEVQSIKRVCHPSSRVEYKTTEEKSRQIVNSDVPLHELAVYFSAYQVVDGMINELEALLVRSFANDLLNIKMEKFGRHRKGKSKGKK